MARERREAGTIDTSSEAQHGAAPKKTSLIEGGLAAARRIAFEYIDPKPSHAVAGQAFVKRKGDADAVGVEDALQGQLGDCWLISAMASVARANPDAIRRLIAPRSNGTYDVTLYVPDHHGGKKPTVINVSPDFDFGPDGKPIYAASNESAPGHAELWPMLIEKAVAMYHWGYVSLNGSAPGTEPGLDLLTPGQGQRLAVKDNDPSLIIAQAERWIAQHRPVVVQTVADKSTNGPMSLTPMIWPSHVYSVLEADPHNGTLTIRDPNGYSSVLRAADIRRFLLWFLVGASLK